MASRSPRAVVDLELRAAEPFRALRFGVESRLRPHSRGVLFTSPRAGDGTSTTAANFALVTAQRQTPVLLIDANRRKPRLHDVFGLPLAPGLSEALDGGIEAAELARPVWNGGPLSVLTAGAPVGIYAETAASHAMAELLERGAQAFERIVIDAPPTLAAADAWELASHPGIDVVLVVRHSSRSRDVRAALRRLALAEAHVVGTVIVDRGRTRTRFAAA